MDSELCGDGDCHGARWRSCVAAFGAGVRFQNGRVGGTRGGIKTDGMGLGCLMRLSGGCVCRGFMD